MMRMHREHSYIDRFWKISYPLTLLILLAFLIFMDFLISLVFRLRFFPKDPMDLVAYIMRLSSIIFSFSALRTIYYRADETISDLAGRFNRRKEIRESLISLKTEISFLNRPLHHLLAGILANALYLLILYSYVFPVLKWEPYHVFSNAFWAGMLGIGCYAAIYGIRSTSRFLNILRSYEVIDLYHEDGMGGLSGVSRLFTEVVALLAIAAGLWIGSIPYAFKYSFLLLILCLGLMAELSVLVYAFYQLHLMLSMIRRAKLQEYFSIFHKANTIRDMPLEEKVNFLIDLFLAEFALTQAYRLRLWPIDRKAILEAFSALTSFLPAALQYLLYLFS